MLKKRFSNTLLALVVAAAIPGSAFAADVASESTGEVSAPASVLDSVSRTNEADNGGGANTDTSGGLDSGTAGEAQNPADEDLVADDQQEDDSDQNAAVVVPQPDTEDEQLPAVVEPDPEDGTDVVVEEPAVEEQLVDEVSEEPGVDAETPVVEEQLAEEVVEPVAPILEPEVIAEETILPVAEEAVVTEAAIVVEPVIVEPVAATLTIIHRLTVGGKDIEEIQVVTDLEVGQTIYLEEYFASEEWVECTSQVTNITLDGSENTIILEYGVKPEFEEIVASGE
jgi:hypothetical protein